MWLIFFGFSIFGALWGFLFTMLLIRFDTKWKYAIELLVSANGTTSFLSLLPRLNITAKNEKSVAMIGCMLGFCLCTIIVLIAMAYLIKDKDDKDIIRIRDIFLGQKSYIEKYYEVRKRELDDKKLNIPELEKKEKKLADWEKQLDKMETSLMEQQRLNRDEDSRIQELGKEMLKVPLPENFSFTLTEEYIALIPSYFKDIFNCISEVKHISEDFLTLYTPDLTKFETYLISIATAVSCKIFNGNSSDIRIHFRFYNKRRNGYEKLIAIKGNQPVPEDLTFIPYNADSMIIKSYKCKCALIKSINHTHDYPGNNRKVWKDYMTYTFYSIEDNDIPLLSFGISVKNDIRYQKIFYFLNFIKFEDYLQEYMEQINNKHSIKRILSLKG